MAQTHAHGGARQERAPRRRAGNPSAEEVAIANASLRIIARRVDLLQEQYAMALAERENEIKAAARAGMTYQAIGDILGLSRSRIEQILRTAPQTVAERASRLSSTK